MKLRIASLLSLTALGGCVVGPNYAPVPVAIPAAYRADVAVGSPAAVADWWKGFGDAELDSLVARGLAENLELSQAASRIAQARAQQRIVRAGAGPTLNASAQAGYTKLSENALPSALTSLGTGLASGSGIGFPGEGFASYQTGFDASWELDLFGGQKRALEAADSRTEAAVWARRDAEVSLTAEIARTYLDYRILQQRLILADANIALETERGEVVGARAAQGLVASTEQRRATGTAAQLIAQREDLTAQRDSKVLALTTLLDLSPGALDQELAGPPAAPPALIDIPAGLPSDLLRRRPDIRAAESRFAAATADIGVATADLYPSLDLTGALLLSSQSLSTLLEGNSLQSSAAGRLSGPLFDAGRRRATVDLRKAQAQEAALAYRATIGIALREVEDGLQRLQADRRRVERLKIAAEAAADAADTSSVRYRHGLIALDELIDARQSANTAADALVQAQAQAAQDIAAVYKALGGGWDARRAATVEGDADGRNN